MDFYLQHNRLHSQGTFPTFLTQDTVTSIIVKGRLISLVGSILGVTVVMVMMMAMVAVVMFPLLDATGTVAVMMMLLGWCGVL